MSQRRERGPMIRTALMIPAIILGTLAPYAIQAVANPLPVHAQPCADLIIGVDGTGSVQDPHSLVKHRAGPGAWIIDYPGEIFPLGERTYNESVRIGVAETKRVIREFRAINPCGTVHGIAHSQGSRVLGDAIEELFAEGMDTSFITAELLADPRQDNTGVEVVLSWLRIPGYTMNGPRTSFGGAHVTQVCVPSDPVCDFPRSVYGIAGIVPNFVKLHSRY